MRTLLVKVEIGILDNILKGPYNNE